MTSVRGGPADAASPSFVRWFGLGRTFRPIAGAPTTAVAAAVVFALASLARGRRAGGSPPPPRSSGGRRRVLKFDAANCLWTSLTCRALLISSVVVGGCRPRTPALRCARLLLRRACCRTGCFFCRSQVIAGRWCSLHCRRPSGDAALS